VFDLRLFFFPFLKAVVQRDYTNHVYTIIHSEVSKVDLFNRESLTRFTENVVRKNFRFRCEL